MSARIEWYQIEGMPTDEEREILLASLEQYLRSEQAPAEAPWSEGTASGRLNHTVSGWGGTTSWSGLSSSQPV